MILLPGAMPAAHVGEPTRTSVTVLSPPSRQPARSSSAVGGRGVVSYTRSWKRRYQSWSVSACQTFVRWSPHSLTRRLTFLPRLKPTGQHSVADSTAVDMGIARQSEAMAIRIAQVYPQADNLDRARGLGERVAHRRSPHGRDPWHPRRQSAPRVGRRSSRFARLSGAASAALASGSQWAWSRAATTARNTNLRRVHRRIESAQSSLRGSGHDVQVQCSAANRYGTQLRARFCSALGWLWA